MAIKSTFCRVRERQVVFITDLEGRVTRVICSEYDERDHGCRILARVDESPLEERSMRCALMNRAVSRRGPCRDDV